MTCERFRRNGGFTLIEVLVALAIIAFGLVAVFGQVSQTASAASRLRDKTLAHWVAINAVTELRLRGDFPAVGTQSDDIEMANTRWRYEIKISETASDKLRRADVSVAFEDDPGRPLATTVGFLPQPGETTGLAPAGSGWPLVSPDGVLDEDVPPGPAAGTAGGAPPPVEAGGSAR